MRGTWLVALAVWTSALPIAATATGSREEALERAFDGLSQGPGASGTAGSDALAVLANDDLSATRLEGFLEAYLLARERGFGPELHRWLATAALHGDPPVRAKLQEALAPALAAKLGQLFAEHGEKLGAAATVDAARRDTVANTLQLLAALAQPNTDVSRTTRRAVYDALAALVARFPYFLRKSVTLDARSRPLLATIRAQLYQIMRDVKPLDARTFVEDTGFHGRYATLVLRDGLLVLDNNCLDDSQLDAIESLRRAIPAALHDETFVSVHECLGTPRNADGSWALRLHGSRGVNISRLPIRAQQENQFPEDSESVAISSFCAVLQHELNHVVDAHGIGSTPRLVARKRELIERSASEPLQLLRSQYERPGGGVFRDAPQEFFASIANQYLADSRQTLELGYERWLQGYAEPLNQFVFFLEVYSLGGESSLFFRQDPACRYEVERVSVRRDERGHIRGLVVDETFYEFRVDERGNVVH